MHAFLRGAHIYPRPKPFFFFKTPEASRRNALGASGEVSLRVFPESLVVVKGRGVKRGIKGVKMGLKGLKGVQPTVHCQEFQRHSLSGFVGDLRNNVLFFENPRMFVWLGRLLGNFGHSFVLWTW